MNQHSTWKSYYCTGKEYDGPQTVTSFLLSVSEMEPEQPSMEMQQPSPDFLPESHSSSEDSSQRDSPAEEEPTPEEQAIHRVAIHLRTIGDEMNAVYLQRRVRSLCEMYSR